MKNPIRIACEPKILFRSPEPKTIYTYSPSIYVCEGGRLIVSLDLGGPGMREYPGAIISCDGGSLGKLFYSDDGGESWTHCADFPFLHARLFGCGGSIWLIGHDGNVCIMRSTDNGASWGQTCHLTEGESWMSAACNVWREGGRVRLVMERLDSPGWQNMRPVILSADENAELTLRSSWVFSDTFTARESIDLDKTAYTPIPFYDIAGDRCAELLPGRLSAGAFGWLETNIVRIKDSSHIWYDPTGRTYHLFARLHYGGTGFCALIKAVENENGGFTPCFERNPSGREVVFLPMPGGHMKFYMLYDEPTGLYWLLSTQPTDSMIKPELLPPDRFNLPNNERSRLALHFSKNCVDWCFAGLVDAGETQRQARHYASMAIDGGDLVIVSRSGDRDAFDAHNTDIITFHRVTDFRSLVY